MRWLLALCLAAPAWGLDVPKGSKERLTDALRGRGDVLTRTVKRIGNRTIEVSLLISADADYESAKKIFGAHKQYREWALKNINVRSDGSSYVVKFMGCDPLPNGDLFFPLRVDLPIFGRDLDANIGVRTESVEGGFAVHAKTTMDNHPKSVGTVDGYLFFFPAPKEPRRLFGELVGHITLKSAFLYEALPERLLVRETSERIQTLLENYRDRELELRAPAGKR